MAFFLFSLAETAAALGDSPIPECHSGLHYFTFKGLERKYEWFNAIF
jgi:hypothetical protein